MMARSESAAAGQAGTPPSRSVEHVYAALCQILASPFGKLAPQPPSPEPVPSWSKGRQLQHVSWSEFSTADWDLLAATARVEGIAPLVHHILDTTALGPTAQPVRQAGPPGHGPGPLAQMPERTRDELQAAYYANAAYNAIMYRELDRILAATGSRAIPMVVLKGTALAKSAYVNSALRPLRDIDLLLHRRDLVPAMEALQALGYREAHPTRDTNLNAMLGYDVHFRGGPEGGIVIDLHWNLIGGDADWRSPPTTWFWSQTRPWERGNESRDGGRRAAKPGDRPPAFQLTPTAQLLYSAAHLSLQHGGAQARLIWYYDLHLLAASQPCEVDWEQLSARAHQFRWAAALLAALRGTHERFGTPLPASFLHSLEHHQDHQSARVVARKARAVQSRTTVTRDKFTSLDWPGRLRLAWSIACPAPTYIRWRYKPRPVWLWPLYYVYRWYDMARDGLATLWRLATDQQ